jgi:hypothetical protein
MALSLEVAKRIVDVVAADINCKKIIEPLSVSPNPLTDIVLEQTQTAGAVRNIPWVAAWINNNISKDEMDKHTCLGVTQVTVEAILKARIPGVRSCSGSHRVHWGTDHEATRIRTDDDGEYVFDWHATLKLRNPTISKAEDWVAATNAVHFARFKGFS